MKDMTEKKSRKIVKAKDYFANRKKQSTNKTSTANEDKRQPQFIGSILKNGNYRLKIEKFDDDLRGVAHFNGKTVLVKGGIPGEIEEVCVKKILPDTIFADFVSAENSSKMRIEVRCPYYMDCGNCNALHIDYSSQLEIKKKYVEKNLVGYNVNDVISVNQFSYRNKVHLAFDEQNNKTIVGFFNETSHTITEVKRCLLHDKWIEHLIKTLGLWANKFHLHAYKPYSRKGLLRFSAARYINGSLMLTIVATSSNLNGIKMLYDELCAVFDKVSLFVLENKSGSPDVMNGKIYHMHGEDRLFGEMLGVKFGLSPESFFQVNTACAEKIYSDICDIITKSSAEMVIDCFSGIGITSVLFAKTGKKVISVEIVKDAVMDARRLIAENGQKNSVNAIVGNVEDVLPQIRTTDRKIFFVDPPRKGLGDKICNTISRFAPDEVIYLSCDVRSLAEDIDRLTHSGYEVKTIKPYDLFPQTKHIETLIILSKKNKI